MTIQFKEVICMDKEDSEEAVGTIVEVGWAATEDTSEPLPLLAPTINVKYAFKLW